MNDEKRELIKAIQKIATEKMALVVAVRKARSESAKAKAPPPGFPPTAPPVVATAPRGSAPIPDRYKDKKKGR